MESTPAIPATPPAEVLEQLDAAAGVLASLDAKGLQLRLSIDGGDVVGRLESADGTLVRSIPPGQLVDALAGAGRGIALDEQG